MRTASKLLLALVAAIAAMAFAASSASATGGVRVNFESGGSGACNPCDIVVEGESTISVENPLTPVSRCEDRFEGEVYSSGLGHVTQLTNANHPNLGGQCGTQKCNGVGEHPEETEWRFQIEEAIAYNLEIRFCIDSKLNPNATGGHCELDATITPEVGSHHYNIDAPDRHCTTINRVVDGTWEIHPSNTSAPHDSIEILHNP